VRVGRHLQALHTPRSQNLRDAFDERGGNPAPHPARIYEQVFQLEDATGLDPGGEADKRPFFFRDLSTAPGQPLRPQNQILRMGQQVVTVTRIRQRRAGIDIGCGDEVGGPARPDDCHGICPSRRRLRHQHDPPVMKRTTPSSWSVGRAMRTYRTGSVAGHCGEVMVVLTFGGRGL
jgi:hypothetical protein